MFRQNFSLRTILFLVGLIAPGAAASAAQEQGKAFAYVGTNHIITAEVAGSRSFVVNFINLSDFVIVVQPNDLIYRGASGRFYIGQVYEKEHKDTRGEPFRYSASVLIKGRTFTGLTVLGAFLELDQVEELSIRIGSKRFYLEEMDPVRFGQLAEKIGNVDLDSANSRAALQEANIQELGTVRSTDGTSEWDRDWQNLLDPGGVNLPKIIEKPEVTPTEEAKRTNTYGKVRLQALINKNGGLQDVKVVRGLGRGLDERAMDAVKNSWVFLPPTKNGEVLEGTIVFDVDFPPTAQTPPNRP